jgi:transcriptional regulator GlxA family with amidase domain
LKIQIVIFDGFDELDALGIYEPLRMAGFDPRIVSLREQQMVVGANGLKVVPEGVLSLSNKPDLLCVPGGGWLKQASTGAWAEADRGDILDRIRELHSSKAILAAVCTGVLILGRAGLLKGRPAITNDAVIEELQAVGAKVIPCRVVDDGDIVTASGITASLDLGLWLIERFLSVDHSIEVARQLHFERRGAVWRRSQE